MLAAAGFGLVMGPGCVQHTVEVKPIKVEPIHVTVDVNLYITIDKKLDEFFDFEKPAEEKSGN